MAKMLKLPTSSDAPPEKSNPAKSEPARRKERNATGKRQKAPGGDTWPFERDSYASTALGDVIDRSIHAAVSRWTAGLSPAALAEA